MTSHAAFRAARARAVTSAQGSLALVNTQWVDSEQTIWGVPGVWAPLPAGKSGLRLRANAADGVRLGGHLVDGEVVVRGRDSEAPGELCFSDTVTGFVIPADDRGSFALRVWDAESEAIRDFGGIDAFEYDPEWVITARYTPIEGGATVGVTHQKDGGRMRDRLMPGEISFSKEGQDYNLIGIVDDGRIQVVFADATTGATSYSVGRFVFSKPNGDGTITLDFNRAVLPPCAFSYNFNCPLPPKENRLAIPIEAGEKNVLAKSGALLH